MSQFNIKQYLPEESTLGFGNYIVGRTKCINILLVGRTQTGKSTIVETLIDPQKGTASSGFSETREPACNTLILSDKISNKVYQLNIIDTPGLKEMRQSGEINRSDDELLKLASKCVEEKITSLNIVCFVSRAGETHRLDTEVFSEVKKFLGPTYSSISMMVLTHCEDLLESKLDEFVNFIRTHEVSKPSYDFCKLGIVWFGAINQDNIEALEEDIRSIVVQSKLRRVEKMRDIFLQKVIECSDKAVKVTELQRIYEEAQKVQKKAINDAMNKEKAYHEAQNKQRDNKHNESKCIIQ